MTNKEKKYLEAKISRRLSCIKVQVDYQLKYYKENETLYYNFAESMSYIREYMNDIQIAQDKVQKGF